MATQTLIRHCSVTFCHKSCSIRDPKMGGGGDSDLTSCFEATRGHVPPDFTLPVQMESNLLLTLRAAVIFSFTGRFLLKSHLHHF